jgi:hypothetical protein
MTVIDTPKPSLRQSIAAAWRGPGGARRTRPILVASICAGIIGSLGAEDLHVNVLLAYVVTVLVVFAVATAVLVLRDRP